MYTVLTAGFFTVIEKASVLVESAWSVMVMTGVLYVPVALSGALMISWPVPLPLSMKVAKAGRPAATRVSVLPVLLVVVICTVSEVPQLRLMFGVWTRVGTLSGVAMLTTLVKYESPLAFTARTS